MMRRMVVDSVAFVAFVAFAMPAQADMLKRKPGLWEVKTITTADNGRVVSIVNQHCTDAKSDDLLEQPIQEMKKKMCSKNTVRREGGKIIVESVCKIGDTIDIIATTREVYSGDFSSHYRGDIHSTFNPPMMGKEARVTLEGKWLGACKPGQKPGDVIMPNGRKLNMVE